MTTLVTTDRLVVRDWEPEDAAAALAVYGDARVARWLAPAAEPVPDAGAMRALLERWRAEQAREGGDLDRFVGRWALARREDGAVVGSLVLRTMPPHDEDLEIAWQVAPEHWGEGYATEGTAALARWAFAHSAAELFAVIRPGNEVSEHIARRLGMEWVGETEKYYDLALRVYRLRPSDLLADATADATAGRARPQRS
ncbi:GNAT family N-acetyltransferase [Quadrisphaera sp. DSM 44207]|uniref:GNAT family N-acetyltransferase n=1 Tax=Quadrisphaera sp. DSM 44207 TaxID=1881057 RepID=UPI000B8A1C39|nr:GNAT family N-acetyltransferase [Quadrisphaera sp. DSM 44207]